DSDPFNRWDALQTASTTLIANASQGKRWTSEEVDALRQALVDTIENAELDDAFKAQALDIPAETVVARHIGHDVDPDAVARARGDLIRELVGPIAEMLESQYKALAIKDVYSPDAAQAGRRSLRNGLLSLLTAGSERG